jgi:8-oxo-dGTP pyrophosphatase MutT (NUDIX family)
VDASIRDAATVILLRHMGGVPHVLMGQRGAKAAFMPSKFVFPGGAVDTGDKDIPLARPINPTCARRLGRQASALAAAAVRELWEETGLRLGAPTARPLPTDWAEFGAGGMGPNGAALYFVCRAITPPGRTRRFDARFFLADASAVLDDLDDFTRAEDELSHLQWIALGDTAQFDLPFITEVVLAEIGAICDTIAPPPSVPFFLHGATASTFERIT